MRAQRPGISIVIPSRNGGPIFEETLRTVLAQRIEGSYEVLVVDPAPMRGIAEAHLPGLPTIRPSERQGERLGGEFLRAEQRQG